MKTSLKGISLIKQFEGCRLTAYKPVPKEQYYTIGYGHYGPDVYAGMEITQAQADAYLIADLKRFEDAVNKITLKLNQNQFDALVSFTYNCGEKNLNRLVLGRNLQQIADTMLAYNKGSGKVLPGLVRRRQTERALFLSDGATDQTDTQPKTGNPYKEPTKAVKFGCKSKNDVRWLQYELNRRNYRLIVDGIAGEKTIAALKDFQSTHDLVADGICGPLTREKLKSS